MMASIKNFNYQKLLDASDHDYRIILFSVKLGLFLWIVSVLFDVCLLPILIIFHFVSGIFFDFKGYKNKNY